MNLIQKNNFFESESSEEIKKFGVISFFNFSVLETKVDIFSVMF